MKRRILVVEDEPAIVDNIAYVLKEDGFDVVACGTAVDALVLLKKGDVSLVVLDIGLPDKSGLELCKEIRKTSGIPVIFLTARGSEVDRVVGLEIGGDDYVVKPFSPRELAARVKAVLRRNPAPAGGQAVSSPFVVDNQRMKISYFGKPLDLSRYELRILMALVERPGWVFSRDKLMEVAWEEPEASMDRTVDTHVKTLRAKLKKVKPQVDPIETHRGMGYSLKESL
jgi:two-component system catabolic regulation response regulator CreB